MELVVSIQSKAGEPAQEVRCNVGMEPVIFGRTPDSPANVDGPGVSREHFSLELERGELVLIDSSANGSWINGTRVMKGQSNPVLPGDVVEIPGYEIRIQPVAPPPPPPPAPEAGTPELARVTTGSIAPVIGEAPPATPVKKGPMDAVRAFKDSFTGLEKFMVVVDLAGIALLVWYYTS